MPEHIPILLPELGLGSTPVTASVWLSDVGATVYEGDRLLEVSAGEATVDLPAPASGILLKQLVSEDDVLHVGQVLGMIASTG